MILRFVVGIEVVEALVNDDRCLFMRGRMTNDVWVSYESLMVQSGQDLTKKRDNDIFVRLIKSRDVLLDDLDVEHYIKREFVLAGLRHVGTVWKESSVVLCKT